MRANCPSPIGCQSSPHPRIQEPLKSPNPVFHQLSHFLCHGHRNCQPESLTRSCVAPSPVKASRDLRSSLRTQPSTASNMDSTFLCDMP